jgi:hypothetical protein
MNAPYGTKPIVVYEVTLPGPDPRVEALPDDATEKAYLLDLTYVVHQKPLKNGLNVWPIHDCFNAGFMLRVGWFVWTVRRRKGQVRLYSWPWWRGWSTRLGAIRV